MKHHILHGISKFGMAVGSLIASGAGCLVFTDGFRLVVRNETGSDAESSKGVEGKSQRRPAGIGAGAFLLAYVASEAMATIAALHR